MWALQSLWRVVTVVLLAACGAWLVSGQSYVPQVPAFTGCPPLQRLVTVGYPNASNQTMFPYPAERLWGRGAFVYITPFTLRGSGAFGTVLSQLSLQLGDNRVLLAPTRFRLAVYLLQEAEKKLMGFNEAAMIAQTDELTLYPSPPQTVYANLLRPVMLESEGDYGLGIWCDSWLILPGGEYGSGFSGLSQFYDLSFGFNDYSSPEGSILYAGDRVRPIAATGCLDSAAFNQPNQTVYAFCALIETYLRQPANNTSPKVTSLTNVTRYTGVIAINNQTARHTGYGTGYPIVFMEGEVQVTTNAGATSYPPLGLDANRFTYRTQHPAFPAASDLLYPELGIPIDALGIVLTTPRNQTNLFMTNASVDSTIGQRREHGVTDTYFSSFDIFPKAEMEDVILNCNVPLGYSYAPDSFACEPSSAPVVFGDIDLNDLNNLIDSEVYDFLPANLISFRFFTVYTPSTTAYQLSYYSFANPEAIVHMRLGLFKTNTSYEDSYSALPAYQLLAQTAELELVNVDESLIIANLSSPVPFIQGHTYAIGVWTDSIVYGPQAFWGVEAAGLPLPYNSVSRDGDFPKAVFAVGGQTGTQPMSVNACAARQQIIQFQWCATFGNYVEILNQWFLERRFYYGTLYGLSTPYSNHWGTYYIMTAGNGTYYETSTPVAPPPPPALREFPISSQSANLLQHEAPQPQNGSWNLNDFQVQSPDYLYASSRSGLQLDTQGLQLIINIPGEYGSYVFAVILKAVKGRGSPVYQYQEAVERDWQDRYLPLFNSGVEFHARMGPQPATAMPLCPLSFVPWDLTVPFDSPFVVVCDGLAQMQSTYGDNRVFDYADDQEGNDVAAGVVYAKNFTATAGTTLYQLSLDVLNNTQLDHWVTAYAGLYNASDGALLSSIEPFEFLQVLDMMIVGDLQPPVYIADTGVYYVAVLLNHDYHIAQSATQTGPSMQWTPDGLPTTFVADGASALLPLSAYGCVTASHFFCGSFQYYLGDDYSPIAFDYLYQGLVLQQPFGPFTNALGTYQPVLYAVGHLMVFARIARYAYNFHLSYDDVLLSSPGNRSFNYFYTASADGATLDDVGISFLTDDDYGYPLTIVYNSSTHTYHDSTNAQLGDEILTSWTLAPINFTVGVPQCSFLELDMVVTPLSALSNASSCPAGAQPLVWGDVAAGDYFYSQEAVFSNQFNLITLSPFNTGPQNSSVSQLAIALRQNGNVFAHIRMALYDLQDSLLAESNEVTVDNPQDVVLYFTLNASVLLRPASTYYIAFWTDVSLYTAAGADPSALCYYGLQYGYDLQPWPASVGSKEAEYVNCSPLPVAAYGCQVPTGPPPPPPECPQCDVCPALPSSSTASYSSTPAVRSSTAPSISSSSGTSAASSWSSSPWSSSSSAAPGPPGDDGQKSSGVSVGAVVGIVVLAVLLTAATTGLSVFMYLSGKCKREGGADGSSDRALLMGGAAEQSSAGRGFSRLSD